MSTATSYPTGMNIGAVQREFGEFEWKDDPHGETGQIQILGDWVAENIVTVEVPQLAGVRAFGGRFSGSVRFHRLAAPALLAAFQDVEAAGLKGRILTFDGAFVPRKIRGGSGLSRHSWGIAIDLNADWNPYRTEPARAGMPGSLWDIVPIFEAHGFAWGGRWSARFRDGMHFEYAQKPRSEALPADASGSQLWRVSLPTGVPLSADMVKTFDGRPCAPVRDLLRALGEDAEAAAVRYDPIGGRIAAVGKSFQPSALETGRAWLPIRDVAEAAGFSVVADPTARTVAIRGAARIPGL